MGQQNSVDAQRCLTDGEKADLELFQLSFVYVKRQNVKQGRRGGGEAENLIKFTQRNQFAEETADAGRLRRIHRG